MEPEASEQMAKVGANDACHLHIANSDLRLLCAKDGRLLVAWPFTCLRRYMSTRGKFTVEAGRRAPTGEGKFTFMTPQHDEIYKLMDNVVRSRASNKVGSSTSREAPKHTKSVSCDNSSSKRDVSHNGYNQLMTMSPATDHQMSPGSSNSMKNAYAAPYGHLPSRDTVATCPPCMDMGNVASHVTAAGSRLSPEFEEGEWYHSLCHPGSEKHLPKNVIDDEYCTLKQHLSPTSERQHEYNVLHHSGSSQPITGLQDKSQETEDFYHVLSETVQSVTSSGIQSEENAYNTLDIKSLSQSQIPASAPQGEDAYNTLDHASPVPSSRKPIQLATRTDLHDQPVVKTPPRPLARKHSGKLSQCQTASSISVPEGDDTYNKLDIKARPPAPPPPYSKHKTQNTKLQETLSTYESNDMYNTLDMTKVGRSPVPVRRNLFKTSTSEGDEMYNTLDAATRVGTSPTPVPRLSDQSLKSDDMYNTLNASRGGQTSNPVHSKKKDNLVSDLSTDEDMYNTLDKSRIGGLSTSIPAALPRSSSNHSPLNSPVKKDFPSAKRNLTSNLQSECCTSDASEPFQENPKRSSSLADLDSYASIDYSTTSASKAGPKPFTPIPAQRALNTKGLQSKTRKASAPDILSFGMPKSGKDIKKVGKSNLVSNLKASLAAGGLDFSKPRQKPKKLSREDSEELPTYSEIEEHGLTTPVSEDVFASGTLPVRTGRSCSSPVDSMQGEDIYDEVDQSAPRPKSIQINKAKKSPKK